MAKAVLNLNTTEAKCLLELIEYFKKISISDVDRTFATEMTNKLKTAIGMR